MYVLTGITTVWKEMLSPEETAATVLLKSVWSDSASEKKNFGEGGIRKSVEGVGKEMLTSGQIYGFRCVHRPCRTARKNLNTDTFLYGSDDGISYLNPLKSPTFSIVKRSVILILLLPIYWTMEKVHGLTSWGNSFTFPKSQRFTFQR
jgi:hypothetical protein